MKLRLGCVVVGFFLVAVSMSAQTAGSSSTSSQVPPLIPFSSVATDEGGSSLSGVVSISFSLYAGQRGGAPLWTETQNNIQLGPTGNYSVQLGITQPNGVPTTLFTTGEARWLGVRIAEQVEQPRILLLSVPYALKAGDASTIGGLPPSAFVLAATPNGSASMYTTEPTASQNIGAPSTAITGTGTVSYVPLWDTTSDIISSALFQSGTGSTARIGINTTTPAAALDVKGGSTIRGTLNLPPAGNATATKGTISQGMAMAASAFNSGTSTSANQTFVWQVEPASNDTNAPSGTLNLLFAEGPAKPFETGLHIASNGQIAFAAGQAFPGTGDGSVTSVGSGSGLTGGPITTSGTLSIAAGGVTNSMLQNPAVTVTSGLGLSGGGTVQLGQGLTLANTGVLGVIAGTGLTNTGGQTPTLGINTAVVPQLGIGNTFTGNQKINGTVTATSFSGNGAGLTNISATTPPALNAALRRWYSRTFPVGAGVNPYEVCFDGTNIWVTNLSSNNVTKMSASNGAVLGTFAVGNSPAGIAFDGTNIWVSNNGGNTVTELLASTGAVVGTITVGSSPGDIAFDGTYIWVASGGSNVTKVLASSGSVVGTFPAGSATYGVAFDGSNIWVTDGNFGGTVTKLSARTGAVLGTFSVGSVPLGVLFDGINIWVANSFDGDVTKLLASTGAVLGTYGVGSGASEMAFDGNNIWVATGDNALVKLSASTGAVLGNYSLPGPSYGVAFDGANIWAPSEGSNTVTTFPVY
jgi:hypothetical protein